ncbi:NADH-quinone oxidoreductase subunit NuoK [Nitratifractor salsuginis]|uniref:NADH-quinone oxidoreductase subunit K n=1 Tax=Nitratifractor salsuginis (strain DSM 16511 / JCM 12458 / E9I37-1) TaxID=749222 RepID=E6WYS0_NITSE|nr:NADH-quinone oxidoreductase subunit NuoK [Nitratifractor salsuginis]ADV45441.1 NADH dehydrogenase subunit K [Nitratifractor salsuginis DSM 16511]
MIGLSDYLILSAILFSIGVIGVIRRRNLLMLFFATEIMLNAANVAFAALSSFMNDLSGQMFAFFIIAVAASEVAVGLGLLILLYKKYGSLDLDDYTMLKG